MSKLSSTIDILGVDVDTYRTWTEIQMTPNNNWLEIDIHHVRPIISFEVSIDK